MKLYGKIVDLNDIIDIMITVVVEQFIKDIQPLLDLLPECIGDENEKNI